MMQDVASEVKSVASDSRRQNAVTAMLLLVRQLRESLTKSLELVSLMLPKQNKLDEEKASATRLLVSSFASACLLTAYRAGLSDLTVTVMNLLQVLSDSSTWLFHSKVAVPVIQSSLAKLSGDIMLLPSLRLAPSFLYLNLFKLSLSAPEGNKFSTSIGSPALTLLLKFMNSNARGPEANLAIGAQLLGDLLNSGVVFSNLPRSYAPLWKEHSTLLLNAILPCIDKRMFVRKDGAEEMRDEFPEDDEDPMAVNLEPQLFIIANIVDILSLGGDISKELKFEAYKAIGIVRFFLSLLFAACAHI
jgi:hypothetical protein